MGSLIRATGTLGTIRTDTPVYGGSGPIGPTLPTGLLYDWNPATLAGTTPVTAFPSTAGSGTATLTGSLNYFPPATSALTGHPVLVNANASAIMSTAASGSGAFTVVWIGRTAAALASRHAAWSVSGGGREVSLTLMSGEGIALSHSGGQIVAGITPGATTYYVFACVVNGSSSAIYVNSVRTTGSLTMPTFSTINLGNFTAGGAGLGRHARFQVYGGALTQTQVTSLTTELRSFYGI